MFVNRLCKNAIQRRGTFVSSLQNNQKRFLNLHEYQSHQLLAQNGVNVPKGQAITLPEQALEAAKQLTGTEFFVKAQILAGGRGRGKFTNGFEGGVHKATDAQKAKELAEKMLGNRLVTIQSGPSGRPVNTVFIQQRIFARHEMYFAILLDRQSGGPVLIGSSRGGMAIEDVAKETPEAITKIPIDITKGVSKEQALKMARDMDFSAAALNEAADQILKLYALFVKSDCTMVEINPMVETEDNHVVCADAKLGIDDNA